MATCIASQQLSRAVPSASQSRLAADASRPSAVRSFVSARSLTLRGRSQRLRVLSAALQSDAPRSKRSARAAAAAEDAGLSAEEAQDLTDIEDIVETIQLLNERRDMTVQEIRLVLMIEDPREAERRRQMGIENESGCSRDEIADAFREVCEDRMPADRMVLRKLAQDMRDWPRLREEASVEEAAALGRQRVSAYAQITDVGLQGGTEANRGATPATSSSSSAKQWDEVVERVAKAAEAEAEQEKDLSSKVPPWVGYGVLYGISIIPIIIGVIVVTILFLNSLQ